ncbi:hypothetical protein DB32_001174 [Sandaracinus amylolyticus]|uniref:Uncharacterized protein n=1 Tax=Sandaracinus amylolyticus TaxID=927083 RepID=A0A0F6W023_9BACT|nr:hypothetical protein DB32_001174 [Sandaracinus amylolyticus]
MAFTSTSTRNHVPRVSPARRSRSPFVVFPSAPETTLASCAWAIGCWLASMSGSRAVSHLFRHRGRARKERRARRSRKPAELGAICDP